MIWGYFGNTHIDFWEVRPLPGDSAAVTKFDPLFGGHLTILKGDFKHPKKGHKLAELPGVF